MTGALLTDVDLAERFGLDLDEFHRMRTKHRWPCVKFGRREWRFTEEQVEEILRRHTVAAPVPAVPAPLISGQTSRSAARSR